MKEKTKAAKKAAAAANKAVNAGGIGVKAVGVKRGLALNNARSVSDPKTIGRVAAGRRGVEEKRKSFANKAASISAARAKNESSASLARVKVKELARRSK